MLVLFVRLVSGVAVDLAVAAGATGGGVVAAGVVGGVLGVGLVRACLKLLVLDREGTY